MKQNVVMYMKSKSFDRCFISVPVGSNTKPLLSLLSDKGILANDAYTLWKDNYALSVEEEIRNSDFLIAVFSPIMENLNVLYEIGFARGAKKPIFLIVQGEGQIPDFLMDAVYIRASLDDQHLVSFYLDKFLSKHKKRRKKPVPRLQKPLMKQNIASLKKRLKNIRESGSGSDFHQFVGDLIRSQGVLVETSFGVEEKGADMSIWVDSLESSFGNPILIEFKMGNLSERNMKMAENQMKQYLSKANIRSGLLIYLDRNGRHFKQSTLGTPLVIRLDIRDFVDKLADNSIDSILYRERNLMAHGG